MKSGEQQRGAEIRRSVFLIGPPGAGKSAVGAALAERLGAPFFDTDAEIRRQAQRSVEEIFRDSGEPEFRRLERAALQQALARPAPTVTATGGGIVLDRNNTAQMRESGWVVCLQAEIGVLLRRLEEDAEERPLLRNGERREKLRQLLRERERLYREAAHCAVSTDALSVAGAVEEILSRLRTAES